MQAKELAVAVAKRRRRPVRQVEPVVREAFAEMLRALRAGEEIYIYGFGKFTIKHCDERIGRDLAAGESVVIPARKRVRFTPSRRMSTAVHRG